MPPLLPEYLPDTVQVVIQSTPVDWWTIGGTVVGAALGAGLGAFGAYKSAVKAGVDLQRRDKLEQALILVDDIVRSWGNVLARVAACIGQQDVQCAREILKHELPKLDYELCKRLSLLVELYYNDSARKIAQNLCLNVYMAWGHLTDIDSGRYGHYPLPEDESFLSYIRVFHSDAEKLRSLLISELSLNRR